MTPDEAKICDLYVYAVEHFDELADRELTPVNINGILALTNRVRGISRHGRNRKEIALHRSAQATLDLHTHLGDEAVRNEWVSARDALLAAWKDKDGE